MDRLQTSVLHKLRPQAPASRMVDLLSSHQALDVSIQIDVKSRTGKAHQLGHFPHLEEKSEKSSGYFSARMAGVHFERHGGRGQLHKRRHQYEAATSERQDAEQAAHSHPFNFDM